MDKFLPGNDDISNLLQQKAEELYRKLRSLPVGNLGLPDYCLQYFKTSHFSRLFFSIETSAHLLYRSIRLLKKLPSDLVIMDYGAGVGSLYLLAKLAGFQKVIYNDHLDDWKLSAVLIANAIGINIDEYIVGDIDETLLLLNRKNISCNIITSRNVIEHIYKPDHFYETISIHQPEAVIYSSTTANYYNPGANIKHYLWHKRWEKVYLKKRKENITGNYLKVNPAKIDQLSKATRGLAGRDIKEAIERYEKTSTLPDYRKHRSNTADPETGVWAEHLMTFKEYRKYIGEEKYTISFEPGFWDSHYKNKIKNGFAAILNALIKLSGKAGIFLAPFIYIVAVPKKNRRNQT